MAATATAMAATATAASTISTMWESRCYLHCYSCCYSRYSMTGAEPPLDVGQLLLQLLQPTYKGSAHLLGVGQLLQPTYQGCVQLLGVGQLLQPTYQGCAHLFDVGQLLDGHVQRRSLDRQEGSVLGGHVGGLVAATLALKRRPARLPPHVAHVRSATLWWCGLGRAARRLVWRRTGGGHSHV